MNALVLKMRMSTCYRINQGFKKLFKKNLSPYSDRLSKICFETGVASKTVLYSRRAPQALTRYNQWGCRQTHLRVCVLHGLSEAVEQTPDGRGVVGLRLVCIQRPRRGHPGGPGVDLEPPHREAEEQIRTRTLIS